MTTTGDRPAPGPTADELHALFLTRAATVRALDAQLRRLKWVIAALVVALGVAFPSGVWKVGALVFGWPGPPELVLDVDAVTPTLALAGLLNVHHRRRLWLCIGVACAGWVAACVLGWRPAPGFALTVDAGGTLLLISTVLVQVFRARRRKAAAALLATEATPPTP